MLATKTPAYFNINNLQAAFPMMAEHKLEDRDFLLCESCFWCASYIDHPTASRCPVCKSARLARLSVK